MESQKGHNFCAVKGPRASYKQLTICHKVFNELHPCMNNTNTQIAEELVVSVFNLFFFCIFTLGLYSYFVSRLDKIKRFSSFFWFCLPRDLLNNLQFNLDDFITSQGVITLL